MGGAGSFGGVPLQTRPTTPNTTSHAVSMGGSAAQVMACAGAPPVKPNGANATAAPAIITSRRFRMRRERRRAPKLAVLAKVSLPGYSGNEAGVALIDKVAEGATAPSCTDGQHYACEGRLPGRLIECGCGCHAEPDEPTAA